MRKDIQLRPDIYNIERVFANGAGMAIVKLRDSDFSFQTYLNNFIKDVQTSKEYDSYSFNELALLTANLTKQIISQAGKNQYNLESVAWEMGILCYVWRNCLDVCNKEFDKIFIASWEIYFTISEDLNFKFTSSDHLRYENGAHVSGPHGGATRMIEVEQKSSETFIVTIYNLQGEHSIWQNNIQMSPKQMKLISKDKDLIELRGYGQDDFGGLFSNYGISINLNNDDICKITLHIYNRCIDVVYLK